MARTMPGRCGQLSLSRRFSPCSSIALSGTRAGSSSDACTAKPSFDCVSAEVSVLTISFGAVPSGGVHTDSIMAKWSSTIIFFVAAIEPPCSKINAARSFEAPVLCGATAETRT